MSAPSGEERTPNASAQVERAGWCCRCPDSGTHTWCGRATVMVLVSPSSGPRVSGCIRAWRDFGPYPVARRFWQRLVFSYLPGRLTTRVPVRHLCLLWPGWSLVHRYAVNVGVVSQSARRAPREPTAVSPRRRVGVDGRPSSSSSVCRSQNSDTRTLIRGGSCCVS